jgi:hypothetical protein
MISSGEQLFGTSTFGKSWKNGYEALASLDANRNGEVGGLELADLALWFDHNQNGKSEEGEVRRLSEVGVTTLYVGPAREMTPFLSTVSTMQFQTTSRWLTVERGYTRLVDGKKVELPSVDWYGTSFRDFFDAMNQMETRRRAMRGLRGEI